MWGSFTGFQDSMAFPTCLCLLPLPSCRLCLHYSQVCQKMSLLTTFHLCFPICFIIFFKKRETFGFILVVVWIDQSVSYLKEQIKEDYCKSIPVLGKNLCSSFVVINLVVIRLFPLYLFFNILKINNTYAFISIKMVNPT